MECFTSIRIYMLLTFHYVFYLAYRYGLSFKIFLLYAFYNSFIGLVLSKINIFLLNTSGLKQ